MQLMLKVKSSLKIINSFAYKNKLGVFSGISAITGLVLGLIIGSYHSPSIITIDLNGLLKIKAKEYSKISDEQERERKLTVLPSKIRKILPNLGSDIVVDNRCILRANKYQVIDKTNMILKELP